MNDIDRYLERACRRVSGPATLRQHLRKELREHLDEAIEALVATGLSRAEATTQAIEGLGEPDTVRQGMQSVYGQSVTALLVDQAMKWKENTMKSEWKWMFVAQTGLVLTIALALFMTLAVGVFVVPMLVQTYSELGRELPGFMRFPVNLCRFAHQWWYLLLIPLAGTGALFEWKCRSENKLLIRTTILVGASLVSVALGFWLAAVTFLSQHNLPH